MMIVDADSASPQLPGVVYYGVEATHSGMCKFETAAAPGYRTVSTALRDWVGEAPPVVQVRWALEEGDRELRAQREADERRLPFVRSERNPWPWAANSPLTLPRQMTIGPPISGPSQPTGT